MNISKNNIDELHAVIKISLVKADYLSQVESALKNYRKRLVMPGFRKGNAPMSLVKKQYEQAATAEEVNKLLSETLFKYIQDEKLDILGEPLPSKTEQKPVNFQDEVQEFAFDIALAPQFEVKIDNNLKLNQYQISVADEDVNNYVDRYKQSAGKYENAEQSSDNSMLRGDVMEAGVENGLSNKTSVLVSSIKDEAIKANFMGKKVGDVIDFDIKKAFPNEVDAKAMLGAKDLDFEKVNPNFQFKIESVQDFVKGELNQEFFDKIFGEDKIHNEEELKQKIASDMQESYKTESDYKLITDAQEELIKVSNFNIPLDFMKRWLLVSPQYKDMTEEKLDAQFPNLERDLKWNLIQSKLVNQYEIKVSQEEELEEAKEITTMELARYGLAIGQLPEEMLENFAKQRLQKQEDRNMIHSSIVNKKLVAIIKENASLEQKNVSYKEFADLFNN